MMDWFAKWFVKASVTWLALGVTLGVGMAVAPVLTTYRTVHIHMLLLGFVSMMIFGVAYHVLPRFTGHPLYSPRAAGWHWWLANTGLTTMTLGLSLRTSGLAVGILLLPVGGLLSAGGAYLFAWIVWRTLDGPPPREAARPSPLVRPIRIERGGSPAA